MKTLIIYESTHQGNTKKLCDAIAEECDVSLIDARVLKDEINWKEYGLVGFASGIDFGKFYENVSRIAGTVPKGTKTFFLYTCAQKSKDFSSDIAGKVKKAEGIILGSYGCKGFNKYGPWKLIGGMNKNHPNRKELDEGVEFYKKLLNEMQGETRNE